MDSTWYYKNCVVPQCNSTRRRTPNKLFIYVPNNKKIRSKWLELASRNDAQCLSTASRMYFCEDHFDLPNDMANYMEYHIMGTVSQVRMKPGCYPSKFECQKERKICSNNTENPCMVKKERLLAITECLNKSKENTSTPVSQTSTLLLKSEPVIISTPVTSCGEVTRNISTEEDQSNNEQMLAIKKEATSESDEENTNKEYINAYDETYDVKQEEIFKVDVEVSAQDSIKIELEPEWIINNNTEDFDSLLEAQSHNDKLEINSKSCNICQQTFNRIDILFRHRLKKHTRTDRYQCDLCQKVFSCREYLKRHIYSHKIHRKYVCRTCDKSFRDKSVLTAHVRSVHLKLRPFSCPKCPKTFKSKQHMRLHAKKHTDDYPITTNKPTCSSCFKVLPCETLDGADIVCGCEKCDICRRFVPDIKQHMISHNIRPFTCEQCPKSYPRINSLQRHVRVVHLNIKPYACDVCGAKFSIRRCWKNHLAKKHNSEINKL